MSTENRRKENAESNGDGRNPPSIMSSAVVDKAGREQSILPDNQTLPLEPTIERVVSGYNISEAIRAVKRNKGAPGIDGITTDEVEAILEKRWPNIKQEILEGKYTPKPVKRVEIPKPDGSGVRQLGIPTVIDRIIQQALYQVLVYTFEQVFSENSYGFRPGRSAHQAVRKAQSYIREGYVWVVDIDLEKFFDRVNHDILMSRVARKVKDKKILLLIRRYLQSGVMDEGLIKPTEEGTPQGGPLSPLLSNIMLDDFDKELESRGLRFVRYADDCNIYVKSERAGTRILKSATKFLTTRLKLKVNQSKSAVAQPWERKFLGFTFTKDKGEITVHESRVKRLKDKIRGLKKKLRGGNLKDNIKKLINPITTGWANYFKIADVKFVFQNIDAWIRRTIRGISWKQWKTTKKRLKNLIALGVKREKAKEIAYSSKGAWKLARAPAMHKALNNRIIESMGYRPMAGIVG